MLVLHRHRDGVIVLTVGGKVIASVMVLEVRHGGGERVAGDPKVSLGIDAPPEVGVHRIEVWEAIQREHATQREGSH